MIDRMTPGELHELKLTYPVLPSVTLAALAAAKSSDGIAIMMYLLDKPQDWVVRRSDVMKQLGLGRIRFDRARGILERLGLWESEPVQREVGGHYSGREVRVSAITEELIEATEANETVLVAGNQHMVSDHMLKAPCSETRQVGKSDHLHITESLNITESFTQSSDDDLSDNEITTIPSEMNGRRYFIDQGHFVMECLANSIDPSLDDYQYLNKRNWVVDGEQLTLASYIQGRK